MKLAWILARKDLRETARDRLAFIFLLAMPLLFTMFFGLLFGGGSDRLPLALHDADGGEAAKQLVAALEKSAVLKLTAESAADAEKAVDDEEAAAALLIPEGYSAAVAEGQKAALTIVATEGSSGAATVASVIRSVAGRQVAVGLASRAAAESVLQGRSIGPGSTDAVLDEAVAQARPVADQVLADPAATSRVVKAGAAAGQVPSGFVLSSPGMLVNFIMFSLTTAGVALILERRHGTLQRLMTTRVRRWELIAGKSIGMFLLTFAQQVVLLGAAQLFFGVDYLRDPVALLVMMVALSLVASTLGLLLAAVLKSEQALIATSVIVSMSVSALSGAWFPLEITGPAFQFVGHLLPTAWILDGLRGIVVRGFDVADVLPAFWVSVAWAAGFFALAVWRFRLTD